MFGLSNYEIYKKAREYRRFCPFLSCGKKLLILVGNIPVLIHIRLLEVPTEEHEILSVLQAAFISLRAHAVTEEYHNLRRSNKQQEELREER